MRVLLGVASRVEARLPKRVEEARRRERRRVDRVLLQRVSSDCVSRWSRRRVLEPENGTRLGKEQVELARQAGLAVARLVAQEAVVPVAEKVRAQVRVGEESLEDDAHVAAGAGRAKSASARSSRVRREDRRTCCRGYGCHEL